MLSSFIVYHERNFENNSTPVIISRQCGAPWMGDKLIPNIDGFISLEQAIENVKKFDCADPVTAYVILRHPVIAFDRSHALYVFGGAPDRQTHILVDAISGEVFEVDKLTDETLFGGIQEIY